MVLLLYMHKMQTSILKCYMERMQMQRQNNTEPLLIEMRDIVKTFPGTKALDGVTLKLRKG